MEGATVAQARSLFSLLTSRCAPQTGEICLDILKTAWTPAWTLQSVCRAIIALLEDPDPTSPLNCDAGNMVREGDMRAYKSMARMYVEMHAAGGGAPTE